MQAHKYFWDNNNKPFAFINVRPHVANKRNKVILYIYK